MKRGDKVRFKGAHKKLDNVFMAGIIHEVYWNESKTEGIVSVVWARSMHSESGVVEQIVPVVALEVVEMEDS